jgi:hypothetical protein
VITAEQIAKALACGAVGCKCGQKSGGGYLTHCPAHLDETPSLSVSDEKGKLLVKCFGGCTQESVIGALKAKDLWPTMESPKYGEEKKYPDKQQKATTPTVLTLAEFAKAKKLDPALLAKHGVFQVTGKAGPYLIFIHRDHEGTEIKEAVRFRFSMDARPKSKKGGKPMLYGLWRLPEFQPGGELIILEGESDTLTAWSYDLPALGIPGKTLLKTINPGRFSEFHTIYVWQEPDAPELPGRVAARLPGMKVKALIPPAGLKDLSEAHLNGENIPALLEKLKAEAMPVAASEPEVSKEEEASPEQDKKPTQAEILIALASHGEFFHDYQKSGFIALSDGNIQATYPIRSTDFRLWLRRAYFQQTGKAPSAQALNDALGVIEAQALFDGPVLPVFLRVGEHGGRVYLDLGDTTWRAVEVDTQGWRLVASPPVKFVRKPGMLPLPVPQLGGTIKDLRAFLNLPLGEAGEKTWKLIISWLVEAIRPTGPYPILDINGPQGSAKSTTARMLRSLFDPNSSPLRAEPKELRDLVISAKNGWCCAFDNLTSLPQWLSDGLCRLATGGGFATRALYTDDEEALFEAMRPVILTGINPVAASQDLIDRQVIVGLQDFGDDEERQEEAIIWRQFDEARPRLLGALLNGVSMALRRIETLKISRLPRMADFAKWATAAEAAWGWPDGAFLEVYAENRAGQAAASVEADLVASTLVDFMQGRGSWEGTPTELHETLTTLVPEEKRKMKVGKSYAWPQAANVLTRRLRKAQVFLKQVGIKISYGHSGERTIRVDRKSQGNIVHNVLTVQAQDSGGSPVDDISGAAVHEPRTTVQKEIGTLGSDDIIRRMDDIVGVTVHGKASSNAGLGDVDGMDDIAAILSGEEISI